MRFLLQKVLSILLATCLLPLCSCQSSSKLPPSQSKRISIYPSQPPITSTIPIFDPSESPAPSVSENKKLIALTFDDAPGKTLENILSVFTSYNQQNPDTPAYATIFCNASRITPTQRPLLQTAQAMGFELGNHTATHADLTKLSLLEIQREIDTVDNILHTIDNRTRHLFRAPFGLINDTVKQAVQAPIISWTIDTLDWTGIDENEIIRCVLSNKFNGAIVLMHDGYTPTVSALKALLPALKAEGYQAVTLSQMSKIHKVNMQAGNVYIRLRPTKK